MLGMWTAGAGRTGAPPGAAAPPATHPVARVTAAAGPMTRMVRPRIRSRRRPETRQRGIPTRVLGNRGICTRRFLNREPHHREIRDRAALNPETGNRGIRKGPLSIQPPPLTVPNSTVLLSGERRGVWVSVPPRFGWWAAEVAGRSRPAL